MFSRHLCFVQESSGEMSFKETISETKENKQNAHYKGIRADIAYVCTMYLRTFRYNG